MKILFIGNSYTYFNEMPQKLERLAKANGHDVEVFSVVKGGRKLHQHLDLDDERTQILDRLTDGSHRFDVVFLQEQSYLPLADFELFADGARRLAERLRPFTKEFIMYQTWGRKDGHPLLAERGWTHESMTCDLAEAYGKVAKELGAKVSAVGSAFSRVYRGHPELELYKEDLYHPSDLGSCLIALVHYKTLFGEYPKDASSLELPEETLKIFMQ
ncbi:MAG: hypothetical protein IKM48_08430 [Clostridia bacterium]|nr:hypothetical protein [Clostridia bacterium]